MVEEGGKTERTAYRCDRQGDKERIAYRPIAIDADYAQPLP